MPVSLTECNERKRPILIEKSLLSHPSFKSVPVSHTFGGLTLAIRESVSCIFPPLLGLRVRCLVSEEMSSRTDNLLISYNGKLAKGKQGVFDSRC